MNNGRWGWSMSEIVGVAFLVVIAALLAHAVRIVYCAIRDAKNPVVKVFRYVITDGYCLLLLFLLFTFLDKVVLDGFFFGH